MKVLCIGHIVYDIVLPLDFFPIEDNKYCVNKHFEGVGGTASNTARLLSKWGMDTYICGVCGDDYYGGLIKKSFIRDGINIDYLRQYNNTRTDTAYVLVNQSNASRTIVTSNFFNRHDLISILFSPSVILMDGTEITTSLKVIEEYPDAITVMDANKVNKDIVMLAKKVKYLVCSRQFAEEYTNIFIDVESLDSLILVYDILKKDFSSEIIVTLGEYGSFAKIGDKYELIPSISVHSVDTTGAGDIYHGAFIYFLIKNYPLKDILYLSNIAGALSTTYFGTENIDFLPSDILKRGNVYDII